MTQEEINIEIAKECGWTDINKTRVAYGGLTGKRPGIIDEHFCKIPNYADCLNTIEGVIKSLSDDEWSKYYSCLRSMSNFKLFQDFHSSTSLQRCEAFLRVKGLWRNE